jgi:hypothetical protein
VGGYTELKVTGAEKIVAPGSANASLAEDAGVTTSEVKGGITRQRYDDNIVFLNMIARLHPDGDVRRKASDGRGRFDEAWSSNDIVRIRTLTGMSDAFIEINLTRDVIRSGIDEAGRNVRTVYYYHPDESVCAKALELNARLDQLRTSSDPKQEFMALYPEVVEFLDANLAVAIKDRTRPKH